MSSVALISQLSNLSWPEPSAQVRIQLFSDPVSPEAVVEKLSDKEGPVDVYCFYEGPQGLPKSGADFMRESIFAPLFSIKKDAKLYLYSLVSWGFEKNAASMPASTRMGNEINKINKAFIECVYASSFFQYCAQVPKESNLYKYVNEELPEKKWLFKLSEDRKEFGKDVATLFSDKTSLFDCIKDLDVKRAYSLMQYVEGYYFIRESVRKGLSEGKSKIQIAFVLPNDEGKFYEDFPKDIEKMLRSDFGNELNRTKVDVSLMFFNYKETSSRPYYIEKKAPVVKPKEISSYFNYLPK
jgi:hypothetical protein